MSKVVVVPSHREIDVATAAALDGQLRACDPEDHAVVDFAAVEFCDSSGIGVLVRHGVRCLEAGGRLQVVNVTATVRRVFELVGIEELIGLEGPARSQADDRAADPDAAVG